MQEDAAEIEARNWIQDLLDLTLTQSTHQELKDGVKLCNLVNKIKPDAVRQPSNSSMPFKQMENVAAYLEAVKALGVPPYDLFQTIELFEAKNMKAVIRNIHSLGRVAQKIPGYSGPTLGAKLATAHAREFSEEQLYAAKAAPSFVGKGSSAGASQAGNHDTAKKINRADYQGLEGLGRSVDRGAVNGLREGASPISQALARTKIDDCSDTLQENEPESVPASELSTGLTSAPEPQPVSEPTFSSPSEPVSVIGEDVTVEPVSKPTPEPTQASPAIQPTAEPVQASEPSLEPVQASPEPQPVPESVQADPTQPKTYVSYDERIKEMGGKDDAPMYGLDRELAQQAKAKYDPNLESEARTWIEAVCNCKLGDATLQEELKSGVILCNLINAIKPDSIPVVNQSTMPFKQMENIASYLKAATELGVPAYDLFQTVELYEAKNMNAVITSIHSLGRVAQKVQGFSGPTLGAKLATAHARAFSEEQLNAAKAAPTFLRSGSHA